MRTSMLAVVSCLPFCVGCGRPLPPVSEWEVQEFPKAGLTFKVPPSTGGPMEAQVQRGGESIARQFGDRLYVAMVTPPSATAFQSGFDPSDINDCKAARKAWEYGVRRSGKYDEVWPSGVQAVENLSGPGGDVYGFGARVTALNGKQLVHIRMRSFYLPDGSVLDMQYWSPNNSNVDKTRAVEFFETIQPNSSGLPKMSKKEA